MRYLELVCFAALVAGCTTTASTAPQKAVVESEAARQTAVNAAAAGDSADRALNKAAPVPAAEGPHPG
jgi:hypothetical protein